ncbi:hypothetical protein QBL02_12305 [Leucobacter sp. UT-8R-CII-1-4]|uniref:hypothetical protein n=1 Tax=Leucobacter sp. UT-8R-CII-1-4 TaxID=3040075 RepID=UPI0024A964F9|nr:hypothetical protein [Leucobacter sp. UT-8R-CII-1-4]MDI6024322.1 hypothetical protein [Leucobacter sp. UT-8R-CII-1-4]
MNNHKNNSFEDHESDPAHTPGNGWVDEGGASHLGPATHLTVEDAGEHDHNVEHSSQNSETDQAEG